MNASTVLSLFLAVGVITTAFDMDGLVNERAGIHVGNEKFTVLNEETGEYETANFCSRVIGQERGNIFLYQTAKGTCEEVGIDIVTNEISGKWFQRMDLTFTFIEEVEGWECLPTSDCVDVFSDPDESDTVSFTDYTVESKACGRITKRDITREVPYNCDAWQLTLLKKDTTSSALKGAPEEEDTQYILVTTVAYSDNFKTREECESQAPSAAVYRTQDIIDSEFAIGAIQFVAQQHGNLTDPCTWDCFEDTEGICAQ